MLLSRKIDLVQKSPKNRFKVLSLQRFPNVPLNYNGEVSKKSKMCAKKIETKFFNFHIVVRNRFLGILDSQRIRFDSYELPKLSKNPLDLLKKKKTDTGGVKFDMKNSNTTLVKTFFESSNNYLQAQELLLVAYGKNTEAAQVKEAIAYAKDSGVSDEKRLINSIKVTTEASPK